MNTRLLSRHLETLGDRARFNVEERDLRKTLRIEDFSDDSMLELSYRDPSGFAAALAYLVWRNLTMNGQANKEGYVFMSALEKGISEKKAHYGELLGSMRYNLHPPEENP